jgi:hypothetical protein
MVKVSVVVRSGTVRFLVAVQARSIRKALGLVRGMYPVARSVFPIEPAGIFVEDPAALAGIVGTEQSRQDAASPSVSE